MKKLFLLAALCVAATFSACSHDDVESPVLPEPPIVPEPQPLAIAFVEGNSLKFNVGEIQTVHYTITGGNNKTVVKAEMQKADDAYTVKTTPTSATEGTIAITAKTPETENCVVVTVSDGDRSITAEIAVSTKPIPEELAITFAEGNSLKLGVNETKTIHYTITGGSDNTVVKAEMQTPDNVYTVETTPTSATEGTITITAQMPTDNRVIVSVSDGSQTVTAEIVVTLNAFDGKTAVVETPGTLSQLLTDHDESAITELTFIGNLNDEDIAVLKNLPNLAILDMENVNLEELPEDAFRYKTSLTSVKLPKTLKTIEKSAFDGCSGLTSITIPDSITSIGGGAFCGCSNLTGVYITDITKWCAIEFEWSKVASNPLYYAHNLYLNGELVTDLVISDGVTSIGNYAFYSCSSLTSATISDSVTTIGKFAFSNCSGLTNITIPDSMTEIGEGVFWGCSNLTNITIPDSVTLIERRAFQNCSGLTSVTIPDSVTKIGEWAFIYCSGLNAFYGKFASSDNRCLIADGRLIAFAPAGLTSYTIPDSVTTIGGCAFRDCSDLTNITIPNSITEIEIWAFSDCSSLTNVTIPNSVIKISGAFVFSGCSSLINITIPDSVTEIGDFAFDDCRNLTSVTIGSSVTEIGGNIFNKCSSLTNIYCKATVPPSVDNYYGLGYQGSATLYVPAGCKAAYATADEWKNFTTIIETQF